MEGILIFTLIFFTSLLFTWNSSSLFISGLTSSSIAKFKVAGSFTALSMILGLIVEGWKMEPENLVVEDAFYPSLLTILIILSISNFLSIPISVSSISVASLIGASISLSTQVNLIFLITTVLAWFVAPLSSILLTSILYNVMRNVLKLLSLGLLSLLNKIIAYTATFYAAYVLSANNLGFLLSMLDKGSGPSYLIALMGIVFGSLFFSERISYIIGERLAILSPVKLSSSLLSSSIILWILTQFSIPSAITQIILGGLIGTAVSSPSSTINIKLFKKLIISWIITTFLAIPSSYILSIITLR
ncbi:MAG: inorganic phosphate transporter [Aigarchaeota archaeon]|nr:inorganic phosphate transporter [Aigarchaeota archaeon]MCX8193205.1 inorganic phosphate transporter [Nitrososphaeria archaeon]MDW7986346.1 inorganic phosphate transporter [Nitrososphaerota archaeon]